MASNSRRPPWRNPRRRRRVPPLRSRWWQPTCCGGLGKTPPRAVGAGQPVRGWRLVQVRTAVTFGDHPAFGSVTLATWQDAQGRSQRVALGPILGEGRSMPKDLEVKLSVLDQRPPLADHLAVLWPAAQGPVDAHQLPPATRQIWDTSAAGRPVSLCPLPLADLAWLLGFSEWLTQHVGSSPPADSLLPFLLERTGYLLADLAPAEVPAEAAETPP